MSERLSSIKVVAVGEAESRLWLLAIPKRPRPILVFNSAK